MKKDCNYFTKFITGYIDGELNSSKNYEVKAHLDECPDCNKKYLNEKKLKEIIKGRMPNLKAPNYLHRRIRRQLLRKGDRPSFWELVHSLFVYRPFAASFALAVIAFFAFYSTYQMAGNPSGPFVHGKNMLAEAIKEAELQGQIICLDCEFLSQNQERTTHDPATHRSGLKIKDGTIWSFIHTNTTHDLLHNQKFLKKKVRVSGTLFKNSRYIYVKNYELL
ncbi:MAG: zf-HC2 domain-containing protein [bacterium]